MRNEEGVDLNKKIVIENLWNALWKFFLWSGLEFLKLLVDEIDDLGACKLKASRDEFCCDERIGILTLEELFHVFNCFKSLFYLNERMQVIHMVMCPMSAFLASLHLIKPHEININERECLQVILDHLCYLLAELPGLFGVPLFVWCGLTELHVDRDVELILHVSNSKTNVNLLNEAAWSKRILDEDAACDSVDS